MTTEAAAPQKKKKVAVSEISDDDTAPSKPKSVVKKKKKTAANGDANASKLKPVKKKKSTNNNDDDATNTTNKSKKSLVKKKKSANSEGANSKLPAAPASRAPGPATLPIRSSSPANVPLRSASSPAIVPLRSASSPVTTIPPPSPSTGTPSRPASQRSSMGGAAAPGRGQGGGGGGGGGGRANPHHPGRSIRGMPPGGGGGGGRGRGRGRGRSAPSRRGVAQNTSDDNDLRPNKPASGGNFTAPSRPQSMKVLPGGGAGERMMPLNDTDAPPRPQSMIGGFGTANNTRSGSMKGRSVRGMNNGRSGRSGRAMNNNNRPMSRNAQTNRSLPPPPGSRKSNKSKRNSWSNSSHSHQTDSDDGDEFSSDLLNDNPDYMEQKRPASILRPGTRASGVHSKRMNADGSISLSMHSAFSIDEDEELNISGDEFAEKKPMVSRMPSNHQRLIRPGLREPSEMDKSGHSLQAWTQSFKWTNGKKTKRSDFSSAKSNRSLLTVDMEFEEEGRVVQWLRYLRIMAPHPDEKPIKRSIRIYTWISLILDFLTGLVSILTYDDVSYCCGESILSIAGDINWHTAIKVTVYVYMAMIFAEIIPVMKEGFPFNLLNPFLGFLITFAMFFDDRILEAVIMWTIEASAVVCEVWVYRLKLRWHNQRGQRLTKTERDIKAIKKERKRIRSRGATSSDDDDSVSSDLSFGERSFQDESQASLESVLPEPPPKDVSQIRETRLLRERRLLRQAQSEDRRMLRYFLGGVTFNMGLVVVALLLIVMVARSGGLCIVDMIPPNVFKTGQLEKCFDCKGTDGPCEVCRDDGTSHCYYPYY